MKTMYGGPTCVKGVGNHSFEEGKAACAELNATVRSWNPKGDAIQFVLCQKTFLGKFNTLLIGFQNNRH